MKGLPKAMTKRPMAAAISASHRAPRRLPARRASRKGRPPRVRSAKAIVFMRSCLPARHGARGCLAA
ncbi:hypothetical protein DKG74_10530 [Zavarzinia aquatilis]|uniref:Uncharacterized protein n=1 Tax=Zavarzinia aquatilis TaxID=2211142 RepID=A0A317E839_9PROT|nr:hypothetical protein DKG74_10530 [Zavarzinia aquatilis]